ncbi:MAG: HEAT repeat domain-containing protein [Candidatus Lokiarchaeota archaeon]|nr:HEAT repeat domain-containing protein [Candidatus Lokiarchaeota archaeon]
MTEEPADSKGIKRYERLLQHKKKEVRIAAIKEIRDRELNERKAIRLLEAVLEQTVDPDEWDVKNEAIITLGVFGSKHSIHHLAAHLNDDNPMVRESAAYALGQIKDKKAFVELVAALDDESFSVREKAANALAKLGDARAVDSLIKKARSPDVKVRLSVLPSLQAFEADARAIDVLVEALKDKETQARFPAIIAFNKIKNAKAIDPLIENLAAEDPILQKVAADALVFNLGWGSIENNQLTKFGERRRQLLLASGTPGGILGDLASTPTKRFRDLAEEISFVMGLDQADKDKLVNYLQDLDNFFKIVKK